MLEGFEASWSSSQGVIECNLVQLNPDISAMASPIGRNEYLGSYDMEELYRKYAGQEPQSRQEKRQARIQQILLRFAQGRPEYEQVASDPRHRIFLDSSTKLSISIGLSSNIHSLLQEATDTAGFEESIIDHSLTLRIEGAEVADHDSAVEILGRIADSVLFAIDRSFELPLALEREFTFQPD